MNVAIIVAAGSGSRMKSLKEPKQFAKVNGKPLLLYSLETFNSVNQIDAIIVVTNKDSLSFVEELCKNANIIKVKKVVSGGSTRQESVLNGLKSVKEFVSEDSIVLIHDAARPLVNETIIKENIEGVHRFGAVVTALPATDTLLQSKDDETISSSLNRKEMYQAQTPQSFLLGDIYRAHLLAQQDKLSATDDASIYVKYVQKPLGIVMGDKRNFKITTEEDLLILESYLNK